MQRAQLGNTDIQVTRLCLGTMQFGWTADEAASFAVLDAYAEAGGNFLDSADIYSRWAKGNRGGESEEIIGRWMKARGNRDWFVVATKVRGPMWPGPTGQGLGREHILKSCDYSLKRLQVETIDLYQFHWFDDDVAIEESLGAVDDLVKAGKVRALGCSNYPPEKLSAALDAAEAHGLPRFESLQPHHNLVHRKEYEVSLQALCVERGVSVIPYSPLAKGFLTGKYVKKGPKVVSARSGGVKEYFNDAGWAALDAVRAVAAEHETTCAAVSLAWQLAQPGITAPIVGANSPAQLADQLPALTLRLADADLARLDAASAPFLASGDVHPGR